MPDIPFPVSIDAEYRGVEPARQFPGDGGEVIDVAPKLKFEYEKADGDAVLIPLSRNQLDDAADFDVDTLSKGNRVHIEGAVMMPERNTVNSRGKMKAAYFRAESVRLLQADAKPVRAVS